MNQKNDPGVRWDAPKKRTRDKAAKRDQLLTAATEEFAEKGFDAATVRGICARAQCADGLVHKYFNGKKGLLLAIIRRHTGADGQVLKELEQSETVSLVEDVQRVVLTAVARMQAQQKFLRVAISTALLDPELSEEIQQHLKDQVSSELERLLKRHQNNGNIQGNLNLKTAVQGIVAMTWGFGFFHQVVFANDPKESQRLAKEALQLFLRGLSETQTQN